MLEGVQIIGFADDTLLIGRRQMLEDIEQVMNKALDRVTT